MTTGSAGDRERAATQSAAPPAAHGLGALLTTEFDRLPLGEHHGHHLHARVRRRTARFSAGRGRRLSIAIGQVRPIAIEVTGPGTRYDLAIDASDPWLRYAARTAALIAGAAVLLMIVGRARPRREV